MNEIEKYRFFLKDTIRQHINFRTTDQSRGVPAPPVEKPFDTDALIIRLPKRRKWESCITHRDILQAMSGRKSRRRFSSDALNLREMAFLLWAVQGLRGNEGGNPAFRTVPSAGARHSFETYLFVFNVTGLKQGVYRYLPIENALQFLSDMEAMEDRLCNACFGQRFVSKGAVTFVWSTLPYRMEWRYSLAAHRVILMDAGHVCQNLYLACEAINAGTCAVGAYDQEEMDRLLNIDGENEFTLYLAPVGKLSKRCDSV